eukprot:TRINITY_DN933_c0_g1_i4.p1 TRINITY_DN933_c0_g1~~TRINITY_DN933_c0_g1_i4.p1  ORF type:complete len:651 (+),score=75.97 TRINITY_DN933_c0_g1_i4:61-1953(+)
MMEESENSGEYNITREFLAHSDSEKNAIISEGLATSTGYQPMTIYLGDLVRLLGTSDQQEQKQEQQHDQFNGSKQVSSPLSNTAFDMEIQQEGSHYGLQEGVVQVSNGHSLNLDANLMKENEKQKGRDVELGTLSDVIQQIQKEQQLQEQKVSTSDNHVLKRLSQESSVEGHHQRHQSVNYQPVATAEYEELGIQEYDYTLEYNSGDDGVGNSQQQQSWQQVQENVNKVGLHGLTWQQEQDFEIQGEGSGGDEGQPGQAESYGMQDGFSWVGSATLGMIRGSFCDVESIKHQFFQEAQNIKDILYRAREHASSENWHQIGEAALALDGLGFAFNSVCHVLEQEQLRKNRLQEQLSLTWGHSERLKSEARELWERMKICEERQKSEIDPVIKSLEAKTRECEYLQQSQETLQQENVALKKELLRQLTHSVTPIVPHQNTIINQQGTLANRINNLISDLNQQREQQRSQEPQSSSPMPTWDASSNREHFLSSVRQQAVLLKVQPEQLIQQQQFLQREVSLTEQTVAPVPPSVGSYDPPHHLQAPEPPKVVDSPGRGCVEQTKQEIKEHVERENLAVEDEEEKMQKLAFTQGKRKSFGFEIDDEDPSLLNPNLSPFAMPFVPTKGTNSPSLSQ